MRPTRILPGSAPAPRRWTSRRSSSRSTCRAASAPTWPRARTIRSMPARWCSTTARPRWRWSWWTTSAWPGRRRTRRRPSPSKRCGIPVEKMLVASTHTHSAPSSNGKEGPEPAVAYRKVLVEGIAESIVRAHASAASGRRRRRRAPAARGGLQSALVPQAGQDAAESLWPDGPGEDESRHESRRSRPPRRSHRSGRHHPLRAGREVAQAAGDCWPTTRCTTSAARRGRWCLPITSASSRG